jgi:hypothetical protein
MPLILSPPLPTECQQLILRLALENMGYRRIKGELYKLGYQVLSDLDAEPHARAPCATDAAAGRAIPPGSGRRRDGLRLLHLIVRMVAENPRWGERRIDLPVRSVDRD